jgi:hypothetical protein
MKIFVFISQISLFLAINIGQAHADFIPDVHAGEKLSLEKSRSIVQKIEEYSDTWEHIYTKDGIKISSKEIKGTKILAVRGETVVNHNIAKVTNVLIDHKRSEEWVDKLENSYPLKNIDNTARVIYTHMDAPWPVKDRDFVTYQEVSVDRDNRTIVFIGTSNTDVDGPSTDLIRGTVTATGILKSSEDGKSTSITMEVLGDPKGKIPSFIVNFIQEEWPYESLSALKKQLDKDDVEAHQGIVNYLNGATNNLSIFPLYPIQKASK